MREKSLEQISFEVGAVMLNDASTLDRKLQELIPVLTGFVYAGKCSIMLINSVDMTVEVRAATDSAIIGLKRQLSDVTIATRALIDNKPFSFDAGKRDFFEPLETSRYKSEDSLSFPLKFLDRKIGVINFTNFIDDAPVSKDKIAGIMTVISHMAAYLYAAISREQLETKVQLLEEANQQLVQQDELKTNLTGFIVHDLKGPISTIMANLDMLSYEPLGPVQAEYVGLATEDVFRLQSMVLDILDVLKLEEGTISIFRDDVDIRALIEREVGTFRNLLLRKHVSVEIAAVSEICYIDDNLISRVVVNILRNALEHSPEGGLISINACFDSVSKEIIVSIADQGAGIPDELKIKIFEKYFRASEDVKLVKTGSGMGLTFCKLVIEAHGGVIWVEDTNTHGARFVFTLPQTLTGEG
jgi:two-component system sensor histidine kinase KdpD